MGYVKSFEIPPKQKDEIVIASGGVNLELAESIASSIGLSVVDVELKKHGNGELYSRFNDSVRGKNVFVIQSHASANGYTTEEAINEHQYLVSAAAGSSARSVMAIAPYLGHSRGERKSRGREVVPAPLVIQNFEVAGMKTRFSMMSIDLHSPQTAEHLRTGPYEHLTAQPELRDAARQYLGESIKNCVVVAPDAGAVKNNNRHAKELTEDLRQETGDEEIDIDVIFMGKERSSEDSTLLSRARSVWGVDGKICLTFDDMIASGGTMATAAETLKRSGAAKVYVFATHAAFTKETIGNLMVDSIDGVFVTDTLPLGKAQNEMRDKLKVVPIGPLIGRAIYEDVTDGSISNIFKDQNHR
jgi:ribose-phosphate pyrophosphokinase